jgi:hypothetical protein
MTSELKQLRLMKAAPKLLEALKLWKAWAEDDSPARIIYFHEIMGKVDAAIAEAEGVQSPIFTKVYCSQCGGEFGPRDSGYSHCSDHRNATGGRL